MLAAVLWAGEQQAHSSLSNKRISKNCLLSSTSHLCLIYLQKQEVIRKLKELRDKWIHSVLIRGMGGRQRSPLIKEAFQVWVHYSKSMYLNSRLWYQACQDSFSIHPKLVKKLKEFYDTTDPDRFFDDFIFFMKLPLSGITERSPFIDRALGKRTMIFQ